MTRSEIRITVPVLDHPNHQVDSVYSLAMIFGGPTAKFPDPVLHEPTDRIYNFYEEYTPNGVTGVTGGRRVVYKDVWDLIDVHVYSNRVGPKLYIVVHPGGDPSHVRLMFEGQDSMSVDLFGHLKPYIGQRHLRLDQAAVYQVNNDQSTFPLTWTPHYTVANDETYASINVGQYDPAKVLVFQIRAFDPGALGAGGGGNLPPEWSTYVAGTGDDFIADVTQDSNGGTYFTGYSNSGNDLLPITPGGYQENLEGYYDALVGHFNEFYEIETEDTWMTYLGGNSGEYGHRIAYHEGLGRVAIGGGIDNLFSSMPNWLLNANPSSYQRPFGSTFIAIFNNVGQRIYLTRTQASYGNPGYIDLDFHTDGSLYVVGNAASPVDYDHGEFEANLGTTNHSQYLQENNFYFPLSIGLIFAIDPDAELIWFTTLGGPDPEQVTACKIQPGGAIYVVGQTFSRNDPGTPDGITTWNTEHPLVNIGQGYLQTGLNGSLNSWEQGGPGDAFIMRFRIPDHILTWSTYLGGSGNDLATDVTVDGNGKVYVVGATTTAGYNQTTCAASNGEYAFPSCNAGGYFEPASGHGYFIARFDGFHLDWSTMLGPNLQQLNGSAQQMLRVTVDEENRPYIFGTTPGSAGDPLTITMNPGDYDRPAHADGNASANTDTYIGMFAAGTPTLLWSTYFGGLGKDLAGGISASSERVYISGQTHSIFNFPLHAPDLQGYIPYLNEVPQAANGLADGFMAQLRYHYTVGIAENAASNPFFIGLFPNPTTGELQLTFSQDMIGEHGLVIHNIMGQVVKQQQLLYAGGAVLLDVNLLVPGTYIISLEHAGSRSTARFIKQ